MSRILIVDDEQQIRRILSLLLADHGHETAAVECGEAAAPMQAKFRPDIALLDVSLPGIDGIETMKRLLAADPRLICIMMTAYGSIRSAVDAVRLGAFDYLSKPFDNDELLFSIERAWKMRCLDNEINTLRQELESRYGFNDIIGIDPRMREVFRVMEKVAASDATVLISGESGTGKELVARAIHRRSSKAGGPFIAVNCGAIPRDLVEAEFFGHEKGAFTDAHKSRQGKFELASGGTLFLDEIGDLALDAQAKILRALQECEITRIGGGKPISVDTRVIAATNKDLDQAFKTGKFREDLYWRLNVVSISIPPLRKRRQDLPLLIDHLFDRFQREMQSDVKSISPEARRLLLGYAWPGNVRELENTLNRAVILCDGDTITARDLPPRVRGEVSEAGEDADAGDANGELKLADAVRDAVVRLEKRLIAERLAQCRSNRTATASSLGITRKTLFTKMRELNLDAEIREDSEI
ncbi:MAG: sigma-54 dependent transcriptional regulator [Acidobacteriota bacterium]|jgi:two-component system response regulator AtoC|nr:sigma-54 dependent transcriptional regulator [Acidobacteriota bacterium]